MGIDDFDWCEFTLHRSGFRSNGRGGEGDVNSSPRGMIYDARFEVYRAFFISSRLPIWDVWPSSTWRQIFIAAPWAVAFIIIELFKGFLCWIISDKASMEITSHMRHMFSFCSTAYKRHEVAKKSSSWSQFIISKALRSASCGGATLNCWEILVASRGHFH